MMSEDDLVKWVGWGLVLLLFFGVVLCKVLFF